MSWNLGDVTQSRVHFALDDSRWARLSAEILLDSWFQ
jgi:hypothetical protein